VTVNLLENSNIIKAIKKSIYKIPFGIIGIIFAIFEWFGFAFGFMIIPALFAWLFWFWAVVFGILGVLFKKMITAIICLILSFIPIIIILTYIFMKPTF